MRKEPTEAERRLWSVLRAGRIGGAKFKRQEQIGDYIIDFVCFGARLIIEADGSQHSDSPADQLRDARLEAQGYRVLRFWNNEILTSTEAVADAIYEAVHSPQSNAIYRIRVRS